MRNGPWFFHCASAAGATAARKSGFQMQKQKKRRIKKFRVSVLASDNVLFSCPGATMSLGYYVGPVFSFDARTGKHVVQRWAVFRAGAMVGGQVFGSFAEAFAALQYLVANADNKLEVVQRPLVELFPAEYSGHLDEQLKCLPIGNVEVLEDSEEPSETTAPRG